MTYLATLIGTAKQQNISLGDATQQQLLEAGRYACTLFDDGIGYEVAWPMIVLWDDLPHEKLDRDSYGGIAVSAALFLCPEHQDGVLKDATT